METPIDREKRAEQVDKNLSDKTGEIELRQEFPEKLLNQLEADPEQKPLRIRALIDQLNFEEDMTAGNVQNMDQEPTDSATRSKRVLQWIETAIQNWRRNVSNDSASTGIEDDMFEQLVNYIYEYLQCKGKKRVFHLLLEVSRFSCPESCSAKKRYRQLIINDEIMGVSLGSRVRREPLLPLHSDRIDPGKLFLMRWKHALKKMLHGK